MREEVKNDLGLQWQVVLFLMSAANDIVENEDVFCTE
jgi:hypothetical protein